MMLEQKIRELTDSFLAKLREDAQALAADIREQIVRQLIEGPLSPASEPQKRKRGRPSKQATTAKPAASQSSSNGVLRDRGESKPANKRRSEVEDALVLNGRLTAVEVAGMTGYQNAGSARKMLERMIRDGQVRKIEGDGPMQYELL